MVTRKRLKTARRGRFAIEGCTTRDGYSLNASWNGFACPYFTFDEAMKLMTELNATKVGEEDDTSLHYDKKLDAFIEAYSGNDQTTYEAEVLRTVDGSLKVYPIGAFGWTWTDADDEDDLEDGGFVKGSANISIGYVENQLCRYFHDRPETVFVTCTDDMPSTVAKRLVVLFGAIDAMTDIGDAEPTSEQVMAVRTAYAKLLESAQEAQS